tara:strand:- start:1871 stop:2317 length:447 start_codon:yes stop_codon:yes gene_type:complete
MALPLLAAAAAIIGKTAAAKLLKKGGEAALKGIIRQGKKGADLAKKPNEGQKRIEKATKGQRAYAKGQAKAAVATGVGMKAMESKSTAEPKAKETTKPKDGRTNPADFPTYKKDTKSASAFRKAFTEAKKDKKKTFKFEGRSYKVETK